MSDVVEHLAQLIRIPSVSAMSNRPLIDYAESVLAGNGWTVRALPYRDENGLEKVNLIAAPPEQSAMERDVDLAFVCHTDTVPYAKEWTQALEPTLEGPVLRGCGACDVKGFLACLLTATESCGHRWAEGVRIVLTADEEIGCLGSKYLIASDVLRPRRMIIGEPTSLHAARAGKGYCLAQVTIYGREAHSALPDQGVSAIYGAARTILRVEELAAQLRAETHSFFEPAFTTLNIGTVSGGSAKNVIPGKASFLLEWRPIPGQSVNRIPAELHEILVELARQYPGIRGSVTVLREQPGFETDAESELVRGIENVTGRQTTSIAFGSEASVWSSLVKEIVVFGPGDMRTAHSERECVPLEELTLAVEVIRSMMCQTAC